MQTQEYKDYMRSEQWKAKKQERIAIDKGCCMCGRPLDEIKSVQVHHITYKNLGNENVLTDVRYAVLVIRKYIITTIAKEHKELSSMQMALHEKRV